MPPSARAVRIPSSGMALPPTVKTFTEEELQSALEGAELVINAVTSDGTVAVLTRAAPFIRLRVPVPTVSKGSPKRVAAR